MKTITNASLEKIIADHHTNPSVDTLKDLFAAIELIATNIYKSFIANWKVGKVVFDSRSKTVRELLCVSFLKLDRYNPEKGRAFNFITTIMLGWLRQIYRSKRNYAELKAKYAEKIRNS